MRRDVYNLQFPSYCHAMTICGYRFTRVAGYERALKKLQHLFDWASEYKVSRRTGGHAITAHVELPSKEKEATLAWGSPDDVTALNDVLILLSLFTRREVFVLGKSAIRRAKRVIVADPRVYSFSAVLEGSIPYTRKLVDPDDEVHSYDIGLEKYLNRICKLIRTKKWRERYDRGYFLFLAQQAFRSDYLDVAFTLCWTIWEHLFVVLSRTWLSKKTLRRMSLADKVAFLLVECNIKHAITEKNREQINSWVGIRNQLVHDRRMFSERESEGDLSSPAKDSMLSDMFAFIQCTEIMIARILGLPRSRSPHIVILNEFLQN